MNHPEKNLGRKFTYKDYLNWPEEDRWELINGIPYRDIKEKFHLYEKRYSLTIRAISSVSAHDSILLLAS